MSQPSVEEVLQEQIARHTALADSFVVARIRFSPSVDPDETILHLRRFIKRSDIVLRIPGGVLILFPHTPSAYLHRIEERLQSILVGRVAEMALKAFPDDGNSPQDLLEGSAPRRVTASRPDDAWGVYFASPLKVLHRAHERAKDGQALAVKLQGHPWTEPGRLLDHFLEKVRREVRVVDLSVMEGEEVDFDLWKEFFAEVSEDLSPRAVARSLQDVYTLWVIRSPARLPKEAFPYLRAIWNALPPGTSLLLLFVQEADETFAHQVAFEQFLRLSDALVEIHLFPLTRDDFLHMARNILALSLPVEELERKFILSGGYPSLLFPILDQDLSFFYRLLSPPPEPVRLATERARGVMKPSLFQFLQTLSVLGPTFTTDFAQSLFASEDPVKLRTFLERAEQEGWLRREETRWEFVPPLFWRGLYASLQPPVRRRFHKIVFDHFQARTLESRDILFLLQMVWHAWGMEDPGNALSVFPSLLASASHEEQQVLQWLDGFLEDFRDAPLPYPALEQTLSGAVNFLLARGDARAIPFAERLLEQAMGEEARARAALFLLETRIQLGDFAYMDRIPEDARVSRMLQDNPEMHLRIRLRQSVARWLVGEIQAGKALLEESRRALFTMAARSRGTLPLFLERLFGELHTLEAAYALVEGFPGQVQPLLDQASRRARPEGFTLFLRNEIEGMASFFLGSPPPSGKTVQTRIWQAFHQLVHGDWDHLRARLHTWREEHSRYGRLAHALLSWLNTLQRLERPEPPTPGDPSWVQALLAWLDATVAWVKDEPPRFRSWTIQIDETHVPARVLQGMAEMVDRSDVLPHLIHAAEPYPVLRVLLLEWAGWLGYRRDGMLESAAREAGSPWLEARVQAIRAGSSRGLLEREDQWALKALEKLRRTV